MSASSDTSGGTLRARVLRGATWTTVSFALVSVSQFFRFVLLARFLDSEELGQIAALTVVSGLAELFIGMGLTQAIIQRKSINSRELSSVFWLNVGVAATIGTGIFLLSTPVAMFLNSPNSSTLIKWAAPIFLITALGQTTKAVMEKRMLFGRLAIAEGIAATCMLLMTGVLLLAGVGALSGVLGLLFAAIIRSILFVALGRKYFRARLRFRWSETRRFLSFGVFQTLDSLVNYVNISASTVATGRFLGGAAMGGYNLAFNTAVSLPARLNSVMTRVLFPAFSKIQGEDERLRSNYLKVLRAAGLVSVPLLALLALVAEDFVVAVYGSQWAWTAPLVSMLALVGILRSFVNPVGFLLQATDNMKLCLTMNVVKSLVLIPLVAWGAMSLGTMGAAYGLLLAYCIGFGITYWVVRRVLKVGFRSYLGAHLVTVPGIILIAGSVWLVQRWLDQGDWHALIRLVIECIAGLVSMGVWFVLSKNNFVVEVRDTLKRRHR